MLAHRLRHWPNINPALVLYVINIPHTSTCTATFVLRRQTPGGTVECATCNTIQAWSDHFLETVLGHNLISQQQLVNNIYKGQSSRQECMSGGARGGGGGVQKGWESGGPPTGE